MMTFRLSTAAVALALVAAGAAGTPEQPAQQAPQLPKLSGEKLAELMQLSLDEINSRMDVLFDFVDADKDGAITEKETEEWSHRLKEAMHKHQVRQEFVSIDKDSNGKITLEELEVTYTDGVDAANQDAHKEEVRKRFEAVDKDKSGDLTLEEVTILMDPGKDEVLMQIEVDEIMAAQDKDKDGSISLEEFLVNEGGTLTDAERSELEREFSSYDSNKDGKIDVSELRQVISNPYSHDLAQLLESLKGVMENGKLTREQWTAKRDVLAVSVLTDNGEVLRFPEEYEGIQLPFKGIQSGADIEEDKLEDRDEL